MSVAPRLIHGGRASRSASETQIIRARVSPTPLLEGIKGEQDLPPALCCASKPRWHIDLTFCMRGTGCHYKCGVNILDSPRLETHAAPRLRPLPCSVCSLLSHPRGFRRAFYARSRASEHWRTRLPRTRMNRGIMHRVAYRMLVASLVGVSLAGLRPVGENGFHRDRYGTLTRV